MYALPSRTASLPDSGVFHLTNTRPKCRSKAKACAELREARSTLLTRPSRPDGGPLVEIPCKDDDQSAKWQLATKQVLEPRVDVVQQQCAEEQLWLALNGLFCGLLEHLVHFALHVTSGFGCGKVSLT